jgi:methylmalonyl-CoA mutase
METAALAVILAARYPRGGRKPHTRWLADAVVPIVRLMTGGLDEPEQLEVEQGSLALLLPGDEHDRAAWEKAAADVLRKSGRMATDDPDSRVWDELARTTLDGIAVSPLGTRELVADLGPPQRPDRPGGRDVRVEIDDETPTPDLLAELDGGASSLWVRVRPEADLAALLDGVLLDLAPVVLDAPDGALAVARSFLRVLGDTTAADGTNLGAPGTAADADLVAMARLARAHGVLGVVVDATTVHDRGASDGQELGWSMWVAARVLRVLTTNGFSVEEAAGLVEFRYAATDEQFPTIAKLRAARQLWARLLTLSGAGPVPQRQHAVTSRAMMSKYDPWVNMLRTTVAAFAAAVGGADAVTVVPFDSPLGRPEALGRRIARNVVAVLDAESHVGRVADPAGGAFAVERLTHDLALAAWAVLAGLEEGEPIDEWIAETVKRRDEEISTRRRPITGLSEFPHLGESLPERAAAADDGVRRYGAAFEALRDDPPPVAVFLATMGPVAAHTARAGFATNLLAAGGVAVDAAGPTDGVDALVAAYAGQPVVCLAGPDAAYAEWGSAAIAALRAAGAVRVVVAGQAPDLDADDSCAVGVDALAFLRRTREALR